MTGPSAVGSEKGTPISRISTPALARAGISALVFEVGIARRQIGHECLPPFFFSSLNFFPMRFMVSTSHIFGNDSRILVSPSGEVDDDDLVALQRGRDFMA